MKIAYCLITATMASSFLVELSSAQLIEEVPPETNGVLEISVRDEIDRAARSAIRRGPLAGFSVALAHGDQILLAEGYGFADLENDVLATENTIYRIGSVTKQLTAAAIMKLHEDGRLDLEDDLKKYVEDFSTKGHPVTIHQLLNHTSGIKSYTSLPQFMKRDVLFDLTHQDLLKTIESEPFDFEPGDDWRYNNTGYYLLGMVIESASDMAYADYLRQEIFEPLEMDRSLYGWNRPVVKNRARGYSVEGDTLVNARYMSMTAPGAAGAICSTVVDLVKWVQGFLEYRIVGEESFERMTTQTTLANGRVVPYGYGLGITEDGERPRISHGGGIFGFTARLCFYPEEELTVALLANTENANLQPLEDQIAKVVFEAIE